MGKLFHFISYNNAVPIAVSFLLLGAATTYAATNPKAIIDKQDQVVSIDNTYIARLDFNRFTPSVKILSVDEDDDAYYVQYEFSTVDLVDAVWRDVTTTETLTVEKASLGNYRDLGLFVTKQLREKIQAEIKRLKATQTIEKKQISRKTVVTKYKGIIGGFLDEKHETLAGYMPLIKPPKPPKEAQTFARPDPNAPKKVPPQTEVPPVETPVDPEEPQDQNVDPVDAAHDATSTQTQDHTGTSTGATGTTTDIDSGDGDIPNDAPTLAILGNNPVILSVGDAYTDLGAVVTDDHDTDLSVLVYVDGVHVDSVALDTTVAGDHTIMYESTDSAGAVAQVERLVTVQAKGEAATSTPPVATSTPEETTTQEDTTTSTNGGAASSSQDSIVPADIPVNVPHTEAVGTSSTTSP